MIAPTPRTSTCYGCGAKAYFLAPLLPDGEGGLDLVDARYTQRWLSELTIYLCLDCHMRAAITMVRAVKEVRASNVGGPRRLPPTNGPAQLRLVLGGKGKRRKRKLAPSRPTANMKRRKRG